MHISTHQTITGPSKDNPVTRYNGDVKVTIDLDACSLFLHVTHRSDGAGLRTDHRPC